MKSNFDLEEFRKVVFYDGDGKEIASERGSRSSMGFLGKRTHRTSYRLKRKTDDLILGLEVWTDLEVKKLPLKLKLGVGL